MQNTDVQYIKGHEVEETFKKLDYCCGLIKELEQILSTITSPTMNADKCARYYLGKFNLQLCLACSDHAFRTKLS
jgi:hypothetical protein